MTAWSLRFSIACYWLVSVCWCFWWWPRSPWLALAGAALLLLSPALLLALQFVLMRRVCTQRGQRLPSSATLLRAWFSSCWWNTLTLNWRGPWREQAERDGMDESTLGRSPQGQVGVVLVHGFMCNRAVWNHWLARYKQRGVPCVPCIAMTLEPAFGAPLDAMVPALDKAVRRMVAATGRAPLIVAHSMGGLVVRAWLKGLSDAERSTLAAQVMGLGVPHHGTWMARFTHLLPGTNMQEGSAWLQQLGAPAAQPAWSNWASRADNIVFPLSTATLAGHELHELEDASHLQLVFDQRVYAGCDALLQRLQLSPLASVSADIAHSLAEER